VLSSRAGGGIGVRGFQPMTRTGSIEPIARREERLMDIEHPTNCVSLAVSVDEPALFRVYLFSEDGRMVHFLAARQMAATSTNHKKAKTMNLRGMLALWLGKLRIYLSISISH
jgi:hypothetical protein